MKNLKPTLVFLIVLCIFNLAKAQEQTGYNIQKQSIPEDDNLYQRSTPINYIYNGNWLPSNPIGISTLIDTITLESGTVNLTANTVCDNVTVKPEAALTIDSGVTLTAQTIDLHSTSQRFSSLISNGTIVGVVKYHKYTAQIAPVGTNDLIASPLANQLFESFALTNSNLPASGNLRAFAEFNTATGTYQNYNVVTNAATVIDSGKGFRAATTDGSTLTFTGTVRTDDVLHIPISDNVACDTWNLIGNPYPSYLDFESFFTTNKAQLNDANNQAIYGFDGDTSDGWTIWNQATIDSPEVTELIAPGQAFFVKAKVGGGLIDFTSAMRRVGSSDDFILGRSSSAPHHGHVKLKSSSGDLSFSTDFYFNSNATQGFDPGYDAALYNEIPPAFSIYSHIVENNTGIPLAVQAFGPDAKYDIAVPLGVNATQGREVNFSIVESDLPDHINVYLEDTVENTVTLLNTTDYIFTTETNVSGTGRFFLRFEGEALGTNNFFSDGVHIYANNKEETIVIEG